MAKKLLLYISINGATAARWRGGRLTDCELFANDEQGIAAFHAYAAATAGTPAFILVDAVDEDYRFETLPHASSSDRAQMVERKLRQHYRGSPYGTGLLVGRDSSKRRDDRFLFAALTNPDLVTPWLAAITEAALPVGGIFLLPMVTSGLIDLLDARPKNLLLVATHPAGVRLTFFREGIFRLSRLSQSDAAAGESRAIIEEISNTRLYLHALRAATLDEPVSVVLIDHADQLLDTSRAISEDNPSLKCSHLGRADIAARLKIDPALIALSPATIYLQLLGAKTPDSNLAPATVTAGFRQYQSRRRLVAASLLVSVISMAWAGFNLSQHWSITAETEDAARRMAQVNADYQAATRQFPSAPTSADNLQKATELAARVRSAAQTPEPFLAVIGRALDASPQIVVVEMGWQYRTSEYETGGTATQPAAGRAEPAPPAGTTTTAALRRHSGLLSGQVRDFKGDFRNAIESINALADRLRKDPAVESVRIAQLPLNVSSTLALTGNTTDSPAQSGIAEFKLIVVLKQPS